MKCCEIAIENVQKFEMTDEFDFNDSCVHNSRMNIKNPKSIMKWYNNFNHINNQCFINKYSTSKKDILPPFLDNNPDITEAIISFCKNNLINLSAEVVQEYIIETCVPQLVQSRKKELQNNNINVDFIMKENNLKCICLRTVQLWLNKLGFRYCERKKSYYCDSHEKPEVVAYRYKFINRYLQREYQCYRWIQISKNTYDEMVNEGSTFNGVPYEYTNTNGEIYYEFHVDDNIAFMSWTTWPDEESKKFGGCLSVRKPEDLKPIIIFGQDECIFKQYVFTKRSWVGPEGQTAMIPKDEGQGLMFSSFVSREYGFHFHITEEQLKVVNLKRNGQNYVDVSAAEAKRGNASKEKLTESPFSRKLEYGSLKEGYWSYEDMVIQLEDCVDVLKAINGEKYDYCFLFDHSNGHDRLREDGLNLNNINKYYGGNQPHMRDTIIADESFLGPYMHDKKLKVGDTQQMSFTNLEEGPYYMNTQVMNDTRYDKTDGTTKEVELTKDELIENLKTIGVNAKGKKDHLVKLCQNNNLPLKKVITQIEEGWYGKPKGSIQILWERGWIDSSRSHKYYTMKGKTDIYGILDETTSINCLMEKQADFLEQETLLQYYSSLLGVESDRSPVCHPEIAGEGIEFNWGCAKINYRSQPISKKRSKDNFHALVMESLGPKILTLTQCRSNARRARCYMLAYKALEDTYSNDEKIPEKKEIKDSARYNHTLIEKCVSLFRKRRTHRNALEFDKKYLKKEAMKNLMVKMCKPEIKME